MAARGTTFAKQDRDRAKKAKAAEKRERRQDRSKHEDEAPEIVITEELTPAQLLRLVEQLHEGYANKTISFEDFEARKTELMERLASVS